MENSKYPNLRRQAPAEIDLNLKPWSKENLLDGFIKFFDENGRYPTAPEIDLYEFLPSSRQIQRMFGGLKNLRKDLGLEICDYSKGANRSKIAFEGNKRGGDGERDMEQLLTSHFGEYFVHAEKTLYKYIKPTANLRKDSKCRVDFLVYAKNLTFAVDVFYTSTLRNLTGNINAKSKKYNEILLDIYLVNLNEDGKISAESIKKYLNNKVNKLNPNNNVMNKSEFLEIVRKMPVLSIS
jgi:hypothetical protein